jgi:hypothetical protein
MTIQLGGVRVNNLNVGGVDIIGNPSTNFRSITITEDILDPLGQRANIKIVDKFDALASVDFKGESNIPIQIGFSDLFGRNASFDLRVYEGSNMSDGTSEKQEQIGSGRVKVLDVKCVSPEYLKNLDNEMAKSYSDFTTNISKDIITEYLETNKPIIIEEASTNKKRFVFSDLPIDALKKLNEEHVGSQSKGSAFVTFQRQKNGQNTYVISTFERLFNKPSVVRLIRSGRVSFSSATDEERINSIIQMNVDTSFFSPARSLNGTIDRTFNMSTGSLADKRNPRNNPNRTPETTRGSRYVTMYYDALNEPQNLTTAQAKVLRAYFVARLSENYAEYKIHGNPGISLGDVVDLKIPNVSASGGGGDKYFNGKALVVSIMHHIMEPGYNPQYTMTLGCVRVDPL